MCSDQGRDRIVLQRLDRGKLPRRGEIAKARWDGGYEVELGTAGSEVGLQIFAFRRVLVRGSATCGRVGHYLTYIFYCS